VTAIFAVRAVTPIAAPVGIVALATTAIVALAATATTISVTATTATTTGVALAAAAAATSVALATTTAATDKRNDTGTTSRACARVLFGEAATTSCRFPPARALTKK
jgi:hypothetical protein